MDLSDKIDLAIAEATARWNKKFNANIKFLVIQHGYYPCENLSGKPKPKKSLLVDAFERAGLTPKR